MTQVINTLKKLKPTLNSTSAKVTATTIEYYRSNEERMKYVAGKKRGEPVGSGAIESTCRQMQCRMKRCGQFWSIQGDEALLCLEIFWRNDRWELLFPHLSITSLSNN